MLIGQDTLLYNCCYLTLALLYSPAFQNRFRKLTLELKKVVRNQAYRIVYIQMIFMLLMALVSIVFVDLKTASQVLLGGFAYILPNFIFVWRVFRYSGAQQMVAFMVAFFVGEALKLILSAFLVLLIVKYLPHSLLSVLIGYIGSIVSFWFACIWHMVKEAKAKQQVLW